MAPTLAGPDSPVLDIPSEFPALLSPRRASQRAAKFWGRLLPSPRCNVSSQLLTLLVQPCRKVPTFLADHVEQNNLQGKLKYNLFVSASSGVETENRWAELDMIQRRSPHQVGKAISKGINEGRIDFFDKHLSMFPLDLLYVSSEPFFCDCVAN